MWGLRSHRTDGVCVKREAVSEFGAVGVTFDSCQKDCRGRHVKWIIGWTQAGARSPVRKELQQP